MNIRARPTQPTASAKDINDDQTARWGRSRHEGYRKFKHNFIQPAPLLFTQDHHPLWLGDIYRGRSAFLIAGGPSFASLDHAKLRLPGVLTMGLNNSPKTFRPNLWTSVDSPDHFLRSIWLDPTIQKFVPICHAAKFVFNSDTWQFMDLRVGDCPNVVYYKRNERFQAKQYLWEDCINWGNHAKHDGGRSVMLAAIRILFTLGIRRLYLLGVDFTMSDQQKYHFEQDRTKGSIKGNNNTYRQLNQRFAELRPYFEEQDFQVYNCNPASGLKAFDHVSFDEAIGRVQEEFDCVDTANERTQGLYDTKTAEKKAGGAKRSPTSPGAATDETPPEAKVGAPPAIHTRKDLVRLIKQMGLKVGVELGVAKGNFSHFLVTRHAFEKFYLIDKWNDHHDAAEKLLVEARFAGHKNVQIIQDSFANGLSRFPDEHFDFIYIDGYAHTGQERGETLRSWYAKLKPGGLFAGHDYSNRWRLNKRHVDGFFNSIGKPFKLTNKDRSPSWYAVK